MSEWTPDQIEIRLCLAFQFGENQAEIQSWLDTLPPKDARLLSLRGQGLTWKQIAKQLHVDATTAWRKWKKVVTGLCEFMNVSDDYIATYSAYID